MALVPLVRVRRILDIHERTRLMTTGRDRKPIFLLGGSSKRDLHAPRPASEGIIRTPGHYLGLAVLWVLAALLLGGLGLPAPALVAFVVAIVCLVIGVIGFGVRAGTGGGGNDDSGSN